MSTVLLVRHGRSVANSAGVLAGWTPGVHLDETGRAQANALGHRLAGLPLVAVVTSPLERCQETADSVAANRDGLEALVDVRLGECHYGDWTGQELKHLAKDKLWRIVQTYPSAVTFPGDGGESMLGMQQRAVAAVREHDARVRDKAGDGGIWVAVSHGDVIKAVVADALGLHLDQFQRIVVDPCSVTAISYTEQRPFVVRLNDTGPDLSVFAPRPRTRRRRASSDAVVGGGAGAA